MSLITFILPCVEKKGKKTHVFGEQGWAVWSFRKGDNATICHCVSSTDQRLQLWLKMVKGTLKWWFFSLHNTSSINSISNNWILLRLLGHHAAFVFLSLRLPLLNSFHYLPPFLLPNSNIGWSPVLFSLWPLLLFYSHFLTYWSHHSFKYHLYWCLPHVYLQAWSLLWRSGCRIQLPSWYIDWAIWQVSQTYNSNWVPALYRHSLPNLTK